MVTHQVHVRRVYGEPVPDEGLRVLVDRLWPRGLAKEKAALHLWCKEVAPTTELRTWYGHDPAKHDEFVRRYEAELADDDHVDPFAELQELAATNDVVLLTASKALDISHAAALADFLTR
ncbi:DUF488 domain-containing protein [Sanguibacter sp. HDW7]|uniref:DUF488 domain-containing protein n=1 Tax=Sanguibacter sp. HDW7 TaxID=2714931 RepID=UPI00140BBBC8|nr:DUF488 family protein [Sanguibacter sp. HDW7]QIK83671.1 DUF488 family protein [Sanguibacter sp. HDW7]